MARKFSQGFKDFMIALKAWVDEGCPEPTQEQIKSGMGFRKSDSICFQVDRWAKNEDESVRLDDELKDIFIEQFNETLFPFNRVDDDMGDSADYGEEIENESHYENPKRLKWINDTVASFEEEADEDS